MLGRGAKTSSGIRATGQAEYQKQPEPNIEARKENQEFRNRNSNSAQTAVTVAKTACAYARVSSDKQEKEETIASQIEALCNAAKEKGYALAKEFIFIDDGYSGAKLDRPALDKMRDLASDGTFEVVLLYSPDRLARNYAHQFVILEELKKFGCEAVFLNHAFTDSPQEQMLLQIQGVFAEYERALIKERTRRGRLFSARQGKVNWGGNPPYGFNYARKTDVMPQQVSIDLSEAAVVRKMYQWLVEEQLSSYAIQRRLVEQETPTRKQNTQGWAQSSVVKILSSSIYKGETFYNRTHYVDVKRARGKAGYKDLRPGNLKGRANRPREEWIKVSVPVIIDPELWQMAQHQLAINRERAKKNNSKHDYLLRGLLICGCCQRRLIGVWSRASNSRYVCSARFPRTNSWSCSGRSISGEQVESSVSENFRIVVAWT